MSDLPLVSIGCAVYNGEATLERALVPLLEQDYPNIELLIADDGSTDGSVAICESLARHDNRVRLFRNVQNVGLTRNFNALFRLARGKYFMWADQDDIRDRTFVSKAVGILEGEPQAVLCHSQTGAFIGDPQRILYIVTLAGVAGVRAPIVRYFRFLRHYSDTTVYGLIRADALARTRLWRDALGSGNALLFELLLQGPFAEVPEMLYLYSGRGVRNRPQPEQEYERMNLGRTMPWYYFPFLVLALNQSDGIRRSQLGWATKAALLGLLWGHVGLAVLTKILYRTLYRVSFGHVPQGLTELCDRIADPKPHLVFLNGVDRDEKLFPKRWGLRGRSLRSRG